MLFRSIDNILKGNKDLAEVSNELPQQIKPQEKKVEQVSEDKTITVSELFGDTEQEIAVSEDTSAVIDQRLFEDRPFSSLLRDFNRDLGVPESNIYAVNKILTLPEVVELLESTSSKFLLSNKAVEITDANGNQVDRKSVV